MEGLLANQWLAEKTLPSGGVVRFRHVSPDDDVFIAAAIRTSSPETLLHRFFSPIRSVPRAELRQMLTLDRLRGVCLVGVYDGPHGREVMCGARYVRTENDPRTAEIAITVHDRYQRSGLGRFLLDTLTEQARKDGIETFTADVMASNAGMIKLLRRRFPNGTWTRERDIYHFSVRL